MTRLRLLLCYHLENWRYKQTHTQQMHQILTVENFSFSFSKKVGPLNYILHSLQVGLDKALRTPSEELQLLRDYLPAQASTGASASTSTAAEKSSEKGTAKASQGTRTGLLLHKRFTNLPIQLVGALHRNLEEDISWAQQQVRIYLRIIVVLLCCSICTGWQLAYFHA